MLCMWDTRVCYEGGAKDDALGDDNLDVARPLFESWARLPAFQGNIALTMGWHCSMSSFTSLPDRVPFRSIMMFSIMYSYVMYSRNVDSGSCACALRKLNSTTCSHVVKARDRRYVSRRTRPPQRQTQLEQ